MIDTETTGFSRSDRIVEFACITVVDGEVVDEYETLLQPNRDPGPVHVHGITPSMLRTAVAQAPGHSEGLTIRRPDSQPRSGSLHNLAFHADWPAEIVDEEALYLDVLDRCLDDGLLEDHEILWLDATAGALHLAEVDRIRLHSHCYALLKAQILADGIVTAEEAEMSQLVAKALALVPHEFEAALSSQGSVLLPLGSCVCFTGEAMVNGRRVDRETMEKAAEAAGLVPVPRVTKKCDALVAADPLSQSGKANYARMLGLPIIGIEEFLLEMGRQH